MPNLVIYSIPENIVCNVYLDAVVNGSIIRHANGVAASPHRKNPERGAMWTDDVPTPIYDTERPGVITGYEELATDLTPTTADIPEIVKHKDRDLYINAIAKRSEIAQLSFDQVDTFIDNLDLGNPAEVRTFLRRLTKAVVGIIKIDEYEG